MCGTCRRWRCSRRRNGAGRQGPRHRVHGTATFALAPSARCRRGHSHRLVARHTAELDLLSHRPPLSESGFPSLGLCWRPSLTMLRIVTPRIRPVESSRMLAPAACPPMPPARSNGVTQAPEVPPEVPPEMPPELPPESGDSALSASSNSLWGISSPRLPSGFCAVRIRTIFAARIAWSPAVGRQAQKETCVGNRGRHN